MPAEPGEVWLARHGATEWTKDGRHTGVSDIPLVEEGREQARSLRPVLSRRRYQLILSSPLKRAVETASLAGFEAGLELDPDLVEWDYGKYDGLTTAQIRERDPGWVLWETGGPGGETPAQVGARADRVVARVRQVAGDVLLFSHGHFLRVLATRWLALAPSNGRYLFLGTAGLGVLGNERDNPVIAAWNFSADGGPA
jgi:broad specificity phosphatase PhoE